MFCPLRRWIQVQWRTLSLSLQEAETNDWQLFHSVHHLLQSHRFYSKKCEYWFHDNQGIDQAKMSWLGAPSPCFEFLICHLLSFCTAFKYQGSLNRQHPLGTGQALVLPQETTSDEVEQTLDLIIDHSREPRGLIWGCRTFMQMPEVHPSWSFMLPLPSWQVFCILHSWFDIVGWQISVLPLRDNCRILRQLEHLRHPHGGF